MNEKRRLTDRIIFWGSVIAAVAVILTNGSIVYSWYYKGKTYCEKVDKVEVKIEDHEKRVDKIEKEFVSRGELKEDMIRFENKLDRVLYRK